MPRKRKLHALLSWSREKGSRRLVRLQEPAEILSQDIIMLKAVTVHNNLIQGSCIEHQAVPGTVVTVTEDDPDKHLSRLDTLPPDIIHELIKFLDVQSVESLSLVSNNLNRMINNRYYNHLMLPCQKSVLNKLSQKRLSVLKLTCTCCFRLLMDPLTGSLPFDELNLSNLKELNLSGLNYIQSNREHLMLSDVYIDCLFNILVRVNPESLIKLEILTDITSRLSDRIAPQLKKFTRLQSLILHGSKMNSKTQYRNIANILLPILNSCHANHVKLKGYATYESDHSLVISCPWIKHLVADIGKNHKLSLKNMSQLERLDISETYNLCNCLCCYGEGSLIQSISQEAKILRYYNNIDLKKLEEVNDAPWQDVVTRMGANFCQLNRMMTTEGMYATRRLPVPGYDYKLDDQN